MSSTTLAIASIASTAARATASYQCHLRPINQPCAPDRLLDEIVQVKAPNAVEAVRLARLVTTDKAVVEVVRLDD